MNKKKFFSLFAIYLLGCLLMLTASLMKKARPKMEWNGEQYNIENVNKVDAKFAHPYNKAMDTFGYVLIYSGIGGSALLVIIVFLRNKDKKKAFPDFVFEGVLYWICVFYNNSVYRILKTLAGRIRPYMYFPNPSLKDIAEYDYYLSWPSGHSSTAFLTFGYLLGWYMFRHPELKSKKAILIIDLVICIATMISRMLSGNHFLTDVLSGGSIGFLTSFGVFWLCNSIYSS